MFPRIKYGLRLRCTSHDAALSLSASGYTGDGLRAWKSDASGRTYYLYDGADPIAELDANGNIQAVNTFGANGLVSRRTAATNASTFYTFDERGNVAQRLDSNGVILSTDLYDAFGARTGTAAPNDPWGFGAQWGYQTDNETGLVLCTNRYYDPQAGRFLTRDPVGYAGGVNLYGYTQNKPANWNDPLGLMGGPGHGSPIPGWKPPAPPPPAGHPGWHTGNPGSGRTPDYYAFNYSVGLPILSLNGQVEVDRYGNVYWGNGGGVGTPGVAFSGVAGTLDQKATPNPDELENWLKGGGANVTLAYILSAGKTWSTDADNNIISSTEFGLGTPQISGSAVWTSEIHKNKKCRSPKQ